MRRVIIFTYYWPPSGGAGVQRWLKFVKYLPAAGWQATVVVPKGASYPILDEALWAEVSPDLDVVEVPIVEPIALLEGLRGKKEAPTMGASSGKERASLAQRMIQWMRGNVFIPDPRVWWVGPATRKAKKLLRERSFDAMVSTGPPHSVHLIARNIKRTHPELPWVADFRDPWSDMDYLEDFRLTRWARARHRSLEAEVVRMSDELIVTSPSAARSLMGRDLEAGTKGQFIPNGFDVQDGFDQRNPAASGPLVLGFFGTMYGSRNAPGLWRAIAAWNRITENRPIRVDFYGTVSLEVQSELQHQLPNGMHRLCGNLPHEQVPDAMAECHGLVLIQNDNDTGRRTLPGKLFEYIASRRPIVVGGALNSDLERLVISWGFLMSGMDDEEGFARQLVAVDRADLGHVNPDDYRRDRLAERMAATLNSLVERN